MTIEQEAIEEVLKLLYESGFSGYCAVISKALKAKQDRIDELEELNKCLREQNTMLNDDNVKLDKERGKFACGHKGYRVCGKCADDLETRNKTLESALKPFITNYDKYGNHGPFAHGLFKRAKKAIGGGNGND